jgi:hypothetical protein
MWNTIKLALFWLKIGIIAETPGATPGRRWKKQRGPI